MNKLVRLNAIMGSLHFVQGVTMLFLASIIGNVAEFSPQLVILFQSLDFNTGELFTTSRDAFVLPFGVAVASFLLLSAIAHGIIVLRKEAYYKDIQAGINRYRWYEYALSSSIMIVLIAAIFGVKDIASIILIITVNAAMNLFGLMMEYVNQNKAKEDVNWEPFVWGSVVGLVPWGIVLIYLLTAGGWDLIPWYAWAILATYFVSFNLFPVNMYLQYRRVGRWANYEFGEKTYVWLSITAKSVLAWLVFFAAVFTEAAISTL